MLTLPNVSLAAEEGTSAVYLVVGDTRFPLSQADFTALGFRGNRVLSVAPGTLSAFIEKPLHAPPAVRPSEVFFDCGQDGENAFGSWVFNCLPSTSTVQREILVGGWLHKGADSPAPPWVYVAANGIEDVHYDLLLDPVFVHRMYGPGGLSLRLDGAVYPGNPPDAVPLSFAAGPPSPSDGRPTITFNSWILPGSGDDIHGELNSWHTRDSAGLFRRRIVGRGPAPSGWIAPLTADPDAYFPFHPMNPEGGPRELSVGDYVLMRGPLWEDHYHGDATTILDPWDTWLTRHQAWLEMHPIDWVVRVREPLPNAHITAARSQALVSGTPGATTTVSASITPGFAASRSSRRLVVRSVEQIDDLRSAFVAGTLIDRQTTVSDDHVDYSVTVAAQASGAQGRWKGSWLVSWSEVDERDLVWVSDTLPAGADARGEGEDWTWVANDPVPYTGSAAHQSALAAGRHQHYFTTTDAAGVSVGVGAALFVAVFLDPSNPPDELMLQWNTSTGWGHRAYWGADLIDWGAPGSIERRPMGRLPFSGEWVRLEVPAEAVGLDGATVTGMAFTLFGGRATWDYSGVRTLPPASQLLACTVDPSTVRVGTRSVTVRAVDSGSRRQIAGRVLLDGVDVAATNEQFTRDYEEARRVAFQVRASGYPLASAALVVRERPDPPRGGPP